MIKYSLVGSTETIFPIFDVCRRCQLPFIWWPDGLPSVFCCCCFADGYNSVIMGIYCSFTTQTYVQSLQRDSDSKRESSLFISPKLLLTIQYEQQNCPPDTIQEHKYEYSVSWICAGGNAIYPSQGPGRRADRSGFGWYLVLMYLFIVLVHTSLRALGSSFFLCYFMLAVRWGASPHPATTAPACAYPYMLGTSRY